jgi:hypothetical protein
MSISFQNFFQKNQIIIDIRKKKVYEEGQIQRQKAIAFLYTKIKEEGG